MNPLTTSVEDAIISDTVHRVVFFGAIAFGIFFVLKELSK